MNFEPPDLPLFAKFVISILVSILVAIATLGNIAVIILLTTHRLCWKNRSSTYNGRKPQITGYSATCTFLLNLSVADLLHVVLCAPFTLVSDFLLIYWPFGEALCRIVNYAQGVVVSLCAFTHVVLSLDRLTAIKCPIWRRRKLSSFGARIIVLGIWLSAMTIPLPCLFVCHVVIGSMGKTYCQEIWPRTSENYTNLTVSDKWSILSLNGTRPYERLPDYLSSPLEVAYGLTLLLFQYAIPLTVITGTYLAIVYRIWGKRPPGESDVQRDEKRSTAKKRLVKMVIIVATLYAASQLPRHVVYLVTLNNADAFRQETMMYTWLFCQLCTWSATCYNPFIYSWMNRTFRRGMVKLLRRALCLRQFRILSRLSRRGTQSPATFIEFDPMITQANSSDKEDQPVEMKQCS